MSSKWNEMFAAAGEGFPSHQLRSIVHQRRLQESNQLGAVLGRREPAIRLHVAGNDLIRFRDVEFFLVPNEVRASREVYVTAALAGAGVREKLAVRGVRLSCLRFFPRAFVRRCSSRNGGSQTVRVEHVIAVRTACVVVAQP